MAFKAFAKRWGLINKGEEFAEDEDPLWTVGGGNNILGLLIRIGRRTAGAPSELGRPGLEARMHVLLRRPPARARGAPRCPLLPCRAQAPLHQDADPEVGGLACNDDKLLQEMRE